MVGRLSILLNILERKSQYIVFNWAKNVTKYTIYSDLCGWKWYNYNSGKGGEYMTRKQKRFVEEYLVDLNATQAAIRAGYSPNTAGSIGEENLKKPEIKNAITSLLDDMAASNIATVQEIMEHLTAVMRGETTEEILILVGNGVLQITTKQVSALDRIRAAELWGKRYGLFKDKVNFEGLLPVVITGDDQLED